MPMKRSCGGDSYLPNLLSTVERNKQIFFKKSKDRVTLLACANATGTCKIPLTFIHTSARPRCLKNMNMDMLPVHYSEKSLNEY